MEKTSTKTAKKTPLFVCETCDFKCYKKGDYLRHLLTNKHKILINPNEITSITSSRMKNHTKKSKLVKCCVFLC